MRSSCATRRGSSGTFPCTATSPPTPLRCVAFYFGCCRWLQYFLRSVCLVAWANCCVWQPGLLCISGDRCERLRSGKVNVRAVWPHGSCSILQARHAPTFVCPCQAKGAPCTLESGRHLCGSILVVFSDIKTEIGFCRSLHHICMRHQFG